MKAPKNKAYVYRMMTGPNGEAMVIANGEMRPMTPEERHQVEKAMADSAEGMRKAMDAVDSPEFRAQMAAVQKAMETLKSKAYFDSEEFNKQMGAARQEMAGLSAMNSAEMQEKMAKLQTMMRGFDMQHLNLYCCKCKDGTLKEKQKDKKQETPQAK